MEGLALYGGAVPRMAVSVLSSSFPHLLQTKKISKKSILSYNLLGG
jgi:hypothetical protein